MTLILVLIISLSICHKITSEDIAPSKKEKKVTLALPESEKTEPPQASHYQNSSTPGPEKSVDEVTPSLPESDKTEPPQASNYQNSNKPEPEISVDEENTLSSEVAPVFPKNEEVHILQEAIKKFGSPRPLNYKNFTLPGPQVLVGEYKLLLDDVFTKNAAGNYTMRLRASMKNFSYNSRYEVGETNVIGDEKTFTTAGHFTEIFPRAGGGYYLQTVGYINDKNGFEQFLVDVSTVTTETLARADRK